jgi:hypothetical protein
MILKKDTIANNIEIFMPRWHTRDVLLAEHKIGTHNRITFIKAPTLSGDWYISGVDAKSYPKEELKTKSGLSMPIRAVPISALEPLEREIA